MGDDPIEQEDHQIHTDFLFELGRDSFIDAMMESGMSQADAQAYTDILIEEVMEEDE